MIDGENNMILYFYIILRARVPSIFAYLKLIQEFSTTYVRSISKYGHCMCTLEIALDRIIASTIKEFIAVTNDATMDERRQSFADGVRNSIHKSMVRAESLTFDDFIPDKQRASSKTMAYLSDMANSIKGGGNSKARRSSEVSKDK